MTKKKAIADKPVYQEFNRMDAIVQNGNDGTHYDLIGDDNMDAIKYFITATEFSKRKRTSLTGVYFCSSLNFLTC